MKTDGYIGQNEITDRPGNVKTDDHRGRNNKRELLLTHVTTDHKKRHRNMEPSHVERCYAEKRGVLSSNVHDFEKLRSIYDYRQQKIFPFKNSSVTLNVIVLDHELVCFNLSTLATRNRLSIVITTNCPHTLQTRQ